MREAGIQARIRAALSQDGLRLFRNQVGRYKLADGRWLSSGLCIGSSDLIGWAPVAITDAMVGKRMGVFVAIEVKRPRVTPSSDQLQFIDRVRAAGGIGIVATSADQARGDVRRAITLMGDL